MHHTGSRTSEDEGRFSKDTCRPAVLVLQKVLGVLQKMVTDTEQEKASQSLYFSALHVCPMHVCACRPWTVGAGPGHACQPFISACPHTIAYWGCRQPDAHRLTNYMWGQGEEAGQDCGHDFTASSTAPVT